VPAVCGLDYAVHRHVLLGSDHSDHSRIWRDRAEHQHRQECRTFGHVLQWNAAGADVPHVRTSAVTSQLVTGLYMHCLYFAISAIQHSTDSNLALRDPILHRPLPRIQSSERHAQAAVLANVALALQALQNRSATLAERLKKMGAVLRFHSVPPALQQRITDSVEYYWSQRYGVQDRELLALLPPRYAGSAWRVCVGTHQSECTVRIQESGCAGVTYPGKRCIPH
jgi:hypothetical protein